MSLELWDRTMGELREQGTWRESDVPALERYIRALERARVAREAMGGELTAEGYNGNLVRHPNLRTAREAEKDARDYANDLLLTPAARKRHEIESGDAPEGDALEAAFA